MSRVAMIRLAAVWLILVAVYLLLSGQASASEIEAGGPVSVLILVFTLLQRRIARRRITLPASAKPYARAVAALLPDAFRVGKVILTSLIRPPGKRTGYLLDQPFVPGDASPAEAGRRAVVELGASLAPNAFAVCLKPEDNILLLHCLHPKQASPSHTWPS